MTSEELQQLRALCEAATPGPWVHEAFERYTGEVPTRWRIFLRGHANPSTNSRDCDWTSRDAAFIAAARTALPRLIDEVERLSVPGVAIRCACTNEEGDSDCAVHPTCPDCGETLYGTQLYGLHQRVTVAERQLAAARAELASMRPVVEAAMQWRQVPSWAGQRDVELCEAVCEYLRGKESNHG